LGKVLIIFIGTALLCR